MSNRAKFRLVPVVPKLLARIEEGRLCAEKSQAGRAQRLALQQGERKLVNLRYPFYGAEVPPAVVEVIGDTRRRKARFTAAAKTREGVPPAALPEIAFAGRSNVGKSSLINALTLCSVARAEDKVRNAWDQIYPPVLF